jgi:hypothetical protein
MMSTIMLEIMINKMAIDLNMFSSFMKNQVMSNWIELWLSQYIGMGWEKEALIFASNQCNKIIFLIVDVITRYFISVEDWEIIDYFLFF